MEPLIFGAFDITDFNACSKVLAQSPDIGGKLERLVFLMRAREHRTDFDPVLYSALVRRAYDFIRPCDRDERVSAIITQELSESGYATGTYAKRAARLCGRVREALR